MFAPSPTTAITAVRSTSRCHRPTRFHAGLLCLRNSSRDCFDAASSAQRGIELAPEREQHVGAEILGAGYGRRRICELAELIGRWQRDVERTAVIAVVGEGANIRYVALSELAQIRKRWRQHAVDFCCAELQEAVPCAACERCGETLGDRRVERGRVGELGEVQPAARCQCW